MSLTPKEQFEKEFLSRALKMFVGRTKAAALHCNIPYRTFVNKMERFGLKGESK